jgi:predicted RNA polymerase sigma factor
MHPLGPSPHPPRTCHPRPHSSTRRHRRECRGHRLVPYRGALHGLAQINPSPIVELNRGIAIAQAFGPQAGLKIVLPSFDGAELPQYHLLPAVAEDLFCRTGEHDPAPKHFLQAASLTNNTRDRATMQRRAAECAAQHGAESSG